MSSQDEFLGELIDSALVGHPDDGWVDGLMGEKPSRLGQLERPAVAALKRILAKGDFRRELSAIVMWASYETLSVALDLFADPGVDSVDGLQEKLRGGVEAEVDFGRFNQ